MLTITTTALGLALLADTAHAAAFQPKTMRDPLSAREVERGLILGKGWLEFAVGVDYKKADGYWDQDGVAADFTDASFLYTTERVGIRYGIARRAELFWNVPAHFVQLTNATLGTDTAQWGLGDPSFGVRTELYRSSAPLTSIVAVFSYKAPAANEAPGNYIGGPSTFDSFVMTTGTPDGSVAIQAKRQFGPAAVTAGGAYVHRFGGLVQYIIETEQNQFQGRIKPGDLVILDADVLLQLGPVAPHGGVVYTSTDTTAIGTTADGVFHQNDNLVDVANSDGWAVDAKLGAILNLTRGLDLDFGVGLPLRGEDLLFFPIEDLSPTRGTTYSGTLEFRY